MIDRIFTLKARNRGKAISVRVALITLAAMVAFAAASQTACSKKVRVAVEDTGPVRVVVLPFMVSSEKAGGEKELQWAAMAAPALLIKASRRLPDIEIVPFWEVMPVAISAAGAARSFTDDNAAAAANWLSAQWAIMGEIRGTKSSSSYTMVLDFIPTDSSTVPFRYIKTRRMDNFGTNFYAGLRQWLRYATARPIPLLPVREPGLQKMRQLGEALDKEYGWLVTAEPGAAQAAVDEMLLEDENWARLMLRPTMYPDLAKQQPEN
ncbi:MAG: hypothetical protein LBJ21_09720 [Acidobacteriota bacterium]|jgi:hypothetical protein|nr:hypothetical protein [Acidobacteriota bacterium]